MKSSLVLVLAILATSAAAQAPQAAADDPVLKEIAEVRNGMIDGFNKRDIDRVLSYLHPEIVVTWANAEVSHGPAEVRAYYQKMMAAPDKQVESLALRPVIEGRKLYGPNVVISYGSLGDEFHLTDGTQFKMDSRFSSLLVKEDGKWLMKGFHASGNLFDNPILKIVAKKVALYTALASVAVGLILGFVTAKLLARRRKPAAPEPR